MSCRHNLQQISVSLARLERRVDQTIAQCRRFEQMVAPLETWARRWSVATLERWLYLDDLPLAEREMALVGLAVKASANSGAVLDAYEPAEGGEEHRLFCQVARIEWEQRRGDAGRLRVAG